MPMAQSYLKAIGAVGKTVKAKVIKVNPYIASMIYRGLYSSGKGKVKKTKRYAKFRINKI